MEPGYQAAAVVAGLSALGCGAIAVGSWRVMVRVGNPRLKWVTLAFLLLALKNLAKCINLAAGESEGSAFELIFSVTDLVAVALIVWPLLSRRSQ